jgi:hypothetical protein
MKQKMKLRNEFSLKIIPAILMILLFSQLAAKAQSPQAIQYQGVARDGDGNVLLEQTVSFRLSILSDSISGTTVYSETHHAVTDGYGLFSLRIGEGTVETGTFSSIGWGNHTFYLKVEFDPENGTNYSTLGISTFASVPYAMHANSTEAVSDGVAVGDMLYWNGSSWVRIPVGSNGQFLILSEGIPVWSAMPASVPVVITTDVIGIGMNSAQSGGILSDGGSPITVKGICWSTNPNPVITGDTINSGSGPGSFSGEMQGLNPGTTYHVRAFATNSAGTGYGNDLSFTTSAGLFRSGLFLHHSTGGNIWGPNGSSTSVPDEMENYNNTHSYTGDNAVSMNEEWWSPGDNEWSTQHEFFEGNTAYTDINEYLANNKILVVKTCFPASAMEAWGQASDTNNPTYKTVYNYKWHWRHIIRVMEAHPENFFVIWTNAPLEPYSTNTSEADLSNKFCTWAKDTLAVGLDPAFGDFPENVYVFDFFHKLTGSNGMMLVQYRASAGDSHPNATATELVAPQFVQEIFDAAIGYEGGSSGTNYRKTGTANQLGSVKKE